MIKYFKHKINNLIAVNKIVIIHSYEFQKDFKSQPESHDFWEMIYCDSETVLCQLENQTIELKKGELFFHKPNTFHSHFSDGKSTPKLYIISFSCNSQAMRFFEDKKITPSKENIEYIYKIWEQAKKTFNLPFINPYKRKMDFLPSPSLGGLQVIKNYLEIFLIDLMQTLTESTHGNKTFLSKNEIDDKMVSDIKAFLAQNIDKNISINDICEHISYSKAYIFRKFKNSTGKTVMEYYTMLKITKAKQLLKDGKLSVKEISDTLAFDTPNYFSKTFKKHTGLTPTTYKTLN